MAIIWQAWEQDGPNGYLFVTELRSDTPKGKNQFLAQEWIEQQKLNPVVVLITKDGHVVWIRPGHEMVC